MTVVCGAAAGVSVCWAAAFLEQGHVHLALGCAVAEEVVKNMIHAAVLSAVLFQGHVHTMCLTIGYFVKKMVQVAVFHVHTNGALVHGRVVWMEQQGDAAHCVRDTISEDLVKKGEVHEVRVMEKPWHVVAFDTTFGAA